MSRSAKKGPFVDERLWKRIEDDYPLQVDPPFFYTLGKDSSELSMADLTSDSPYNLYTHKGLPPTPIGNPGLDAISATVDPPKARSLLHTLAGTFLRVDRKVALTRTLKNAVKQLGVRARQVDLSPGEVRRMVRRGSRARPGHALRRLDRRPPECRGLALGCGGAGHGRDGPQALGRLLRQPWLPRHARRALRDARARCAP